MTIFVAVMFSYAIGVFVGYVLWGTNGWRKK